MCVYIYICVCVCVCVCVLLLFEYKEITNISVVKKFVVNLIDPLIVDMK